MPRETNYLIPEESNDILSMPDLEKEISAEIARITLSLINDIKEVFNVGLNYDSIEYIEDELKEVQTIDYILGQKIQELQNAINIALDKKRTNYLEYFNYFKVRYDKTTGKRTITLNLPIKTTMNFSDKIQVFENSLRKVN